MAAEADGFPIRPLDGNHKTCLTQTGLLMEGLGVWSEMVWPIIIDIISFLMAHAASALNSLL
jgi:hypothetical protein